MTSEKVLKEVFGYESFRHRQKDTINSVLQGNDTFVLMPTGGGKSLCYQIPALMLEGLTIVISPLIALMKDQVDALKLSGVAAAYLNSTQDHHEQAYIMDMLKLNEVKLLYVAPERILGKESNFVDFLKTLDISLIAIDEAHCISHWGHDFRPEYLMLSELAKVLKKKVPTIALTATADKITQKDIVDKLKLENPQVFISSFNRPNIQYHVTPKRNSFDQLLDFLHHNKDESGIVYTLTRKSTEKIANQLTEEGFNAKPYHAGLDTAVKTKHQEAFLKDEVKIIVATIAFGMGIDKSNVRYVVHMDLPKNIESYYQETGRAGRDGLPSQALLFFSFGDVFKLKGFVEIEDNQKQSAIMLQKLDQMAKYAQLKTCRRKYLLNYFGEEFAIHCGACDNCLNTFETIDGTEIAQKALSAVTRLEERFGVNYIIDFLRGSKSEKIWDRHKNLKTYGVGAEISKEDWRHYINELIGLDYLIRDNGQYPVLKLGKKSWDVLNKGEKVSVNQPITQRYET
ncbi:MAG: DNA helicase RecQ [Bacteroidetes bacterium]|nr:DNA helicase RecQ [Bacteroidota bacterium]